MHGRRGAPCDAQRRGRHLEGALGRRQGEERNLELRGVGAGNLGAIRDAIFDSVTGAFDGVKRGDTEEVHVRVADTPNVEVVDLISDDDEDEDIEIVLAAKRKGETANVVGKRRRA